MKQISNYDANAICRLLRFFGTFKGGTLREANAIRQAKRYAVKLAKINENNPKE